MIDLGHTGSPRHVGGHGEMRFASQNVADESGQVATWPRFDEDPHSVFVHLMYRLTEQNRAQPVLDKQLPDFVNLCRIARDSSARISVDCWRRHANMGQKVVCCPFRIGLKQRRVVRSVKRKNLVNNPATSQVLDGLVGGSLASDQNTLMRA